MRLETYQRTVTGPVDDRLIALDPELAELEAAMARFTQDVPADADIEVLKAREKETQEVYDKVLKLNAAAGERALVARKEREAKEKEAQRKKRWRVYQVWRVLDADGVTDWTPKGKHGDYRIHSVGQVINFAEGDQLNMCRAGTHEARFAKPAITNYAGDRLCRLELEGWLEGGSFHCQKALVLAIVKAEEMRPPTPVTRYVEDTKAQILRLWFSGDHTADELRKNPAHIAMHGTSSKRADLWRVRVKVLFEQMAVKYDANPEYEPNVDELELIYLAAVNAECCTQLFGMVYQSTEAANGATEGYAFFRYWNHMFNKMRKARAVAAGIKMTATTTWDFLTGDHTEVEKNVRAFMAEKYPDVKLKDFGILKGDDPLAANAGQSPTYWETH